MEMRKYCVVIFLMLIEFGGVWLFYGDSLADTPLPQSLSISQIKISGDEFVVVRNNTDADIQLGGYWLEYFNEYSLSVVGISNSSTQLPDAKLGSHREIIFSAGLAPVCGQVLVAKLPFGLKDSAGLLQIVGVNQTTGVISYRPEDQVSWSNAKTNNSAELKLPATQDSKQIWFRNSPQGAWQSGLVDYNSACSGGGSAGSGFEPASNTATLGDSTGTPPYVVLGTGSSSNSETSGIPAADAGLAPPQVSELLPNPAPPQTDANDEFVELYNPNDKPFDLSGFILQTGTTATHEYEFPAGTTLDAKAFEAFYISQTKLTLSNSEGQASLLDPSEKILTTSDVYADAKDGQAWIFAAGKWQWTTKPTPGAVNIVSLPISKSAVKSAAKTKSGSGNTSSNLNGKAVVASSGGRNIHPLILAGVAGAVLLYAGYEYRDDVANTIHKFRRNRGPGRGPGQTA